MKIKYIILILLLGIKGMGQSLDYDAIKNATAVKINGGVSANTVFYNSNVRSSREPFTYVLSGNLNLSWLTFSMPISYTYSNQAGNLGYNVPFNFNKLSLNPKYKWVSAYIGDASMTFSPYTLAGHQFTGFGVDLTPEGPWKFSAMGGRLLKAVERGDNPQNIPAYKRMGYGAKIGFNKDKYKIALMGFYAKDDINSLKQPDSLLLPKENLTIGIEASYQITEKINLKVDYGASTLTNDIQDKSEVKAQFKNLSSLLIKNNQTTQNYNAIKGNLDYTIGEKMKVGLGYERVDNGYATLGGQFFNNDFVNYTVNASRPFWQDKLNLTINLGYQHDDLKNTKGQKTKRMVGSVNADFKPNDKLSFNGTYSNFSTFTNVKANQFDAINDPTGQYRADSLRYRQLSQNATFSANYTFGNKEKLAQSLAFNYSLAAAANEQNSIIRVGQASDIQNFALNYGLNFVPQKINTSISMNYTQNNIGREKNNTFGPSITISKPFFEDKLNTNLSSAYNISRNSNGNVANFNINLSANYTLAEKHNFNLTILQLMNKTDNNSTNETISINELTISFGYSYNFGFELFKKKKDPSPDPSPKERGE